MVTDEMVEKAARAMCEAWHYSKIGTPDGDAEWRKKQGQYRKQARAALEAALSAAEPRGYLIHDKDNPDGRYFKQKPSISDDDMSEYEIWIEPLYAAPPAPPVAVKALHQAASDFMHLFIQDGHLTMQDLEDTDLIPAYEKLSAALSAQVQDVVQYSGPCSLDEFVSALFADGAHHEDMKNALDEWLNQDYSEALSYLNSETRSRLQPAAPAKQEK